MTTIDQIQAPGSEAVSPAARKAWLVAPVLGLVLVAAMMGPAAGFSVTDDLPVETMLDKLDAARSSLLLLGGVQALSAMALVVFGAWIFARLRQLEPAGAMTSLVAAGGSILSAAMVAMAAAHTQLATYDPAEVVDPAIPLTLHTLEENLFAGAWCSLALVAGAVAVAALRHKRVATWLGVVSAFIAVLLVVLQVVVPWAGWFPAAVWLVVVGIGLRARTSATA